MIPRGFRPLIGAEKEAVRINIYEPLLIPGLLQTEEYARLVLSVGLQSDKLEELVSIRMERQVLLSREDPPWIFLLIREAVIRDLRPEVRVGQCKRLLELMDNPKFSVQVLPADALVFHPTGYQVLSFRRQQDIAYMEGTAGNAQMLTDSDVVRQLAVLFDVVRSEAFSAKDSANVIQSIMELREYRRSIVSVLAQELPQ
ncbi:hypothetical protein BJF79_26770 [Actinomadura sp. CNU-125]|nr:hypothetical protein BJF79_26770 [Actinomadura sp. CNU-125]